MIQIVLNTYPNQPSMRFEMYLRHSVTVILETIIIMSLGVSRVVSLPKSVIVEKTSQVPVFVIYNSQNKLLVTRSSLPNKERSTVGVFIDYSDARSFLDKFKSAKSNFGDGIRIGTVSLADIYQLNDVEKKKKDGLSFLFIPSPSQTKNAFVLLGQDKPETQIFDGTPLFAPYDSTSGLFTSIQASGLQGVPLFFEKEELQQVILKLEEQQSNLKNKLKIRVVPLEGFIKNLEKADDLSSGNFILFPSQKLVPTIQGK